MAQDKEFWDKVYARHAAGIASIAEICAEHDLPYVRGQDLYDTCWEWEYSVRLGYYEFPELPAGLRQKLIDDAVSYGEGLYDREQLGGLNDRDLASAYTECVAAYATSQM